MADADHRRLGQVFGQKLHDVGLARLVERRGRLVHEHPGRPLHQHAREGHALLLPARQDVVPALLLVEPSAQVIEPDLVQGFAQLIVVGVVRLLRIEHGLAQGAQREIGLLRHEGDVTLGQFDRTAPPWPDTGDGAHDGALAAARLAADQHALAGLDLDLGLGHQGLAVGPRQADLAQHQAIGTARRHLDMLAIGGLDRVLEIVQRRVELHDTVDGGAPVGEAREVVDQPRQCPLHVGEGLRGLHQPAQLQLAAEIARQRHDQRHDGRQIGERAGQQGKAALPARLDVPGLAQVAHGGVQTHTLVGLAAHQGDALGILAGADQHRADIGLAALAHVAGCDQAAAQRIGQDRAEQGVEHGRPHHVARQGELERADLDRQGARQHPQYTQEGDELQDALQDRLREFDGKLGRDANILGDAAIGVVAFVGQQAELVLPAGMQPAPRRDLGQPASPVDLQAAADMQVDGDGHPRRHHDRRQHVELLDQHRGVALLQGIEEIAIPDVEPERDADIDGAEHHHARGQRPGDHPVAGRRPVARGKSGEGA